MADDIPRIGVYFHTPRKRWKCDFCDQSVGTLESVQIFMAKAGETLSDDETQLNGQPWQVTVTDNDGEWVTCPECAVFVMANDMEGLLQRAVRQFLLQGYVQGRERMILEQRLRAIHGMFWIHYRPAATTTHHRTEP